MYFNTTPIEGAYIVRQDPIEDDRGFFARLYCEEEFQAHGLCTEYVQINNSASAKKGTMRGLHYQLHPHDETKLIRCISGTIFDVIVDLRPDSKSFLQWYGVELSAKNRLMLHIPNGCAHGFLTQSENTEVIYFVSQKYAPQYERGIRYDDPYFDIDWPEPPAEISKKDRNWEDFSINDLKQII